MSVNEPSAAVFLEAALTHRPSTRFWSVTLVPSSAGATVPVTTKVSPCATTGSTTAALTTCRTATLATGVRVVAQSQPAASREAPLEGAVGDLGIDTVPSASVDSVPTADHSFPGSRRRRVT